MSKPKLKSKPSAKKPNEFVIGQREIDAGDPSLRGFIVAQSRHNKDRYVIEWEYEIDDACTMNASEILPYDPQVDIEQGYKEGEEYAEILYKNDFLDYLKYSKHCGKNEENMNGFIEGFFDKLADIRPKNVGVLDLDGKEY